jgi:crossover junction endodeoxyribonuclease RuvC
VLYKGLPLKRNHFVVIGIDPGTRVTGYGIIEVSGQSRKAIDYGCIRPPVNATNAERYFVIFDAVDRLLEKHAPEALAVETQFLYKNAQSALKLGMAKGVAMVAAARRGVQVFEYSPTKAKSAVVGNGRASKAQVQSMVKILLNLAELPQPEDAADALALAICHSHTLSS